MKHFLLGGAFALAALSSATAGPVSDFETAYRQMYGTYRAALFKTNTGDQQASVGAMGKFAGLFATLDAVYGDAPPPQYEDDPLWGATMDEAGRLTREASAEIAAGDLAAAHETLEGVREVFGDLHLRNGVETFSDRMNAYHTEMEHVLGLDLAALDATMMGAIRERAAVLAYLAEDVLSTPPAEAEGNAEYVKLADAFEASVTTLLDAARSGDADALRIAVSELKKPYSLLFVKFG